MAKKKKPVKPNFLIIGAPKAATTALAQTLARHPQVGMARVKEPHFFADDERFHGGWQAYLDLFSHCRGAKAVGEASTSYCRIRYHPQVIERISQSLVNPRIIYMVRHPLARMESAYIEHLATPGGMTLQSINDAVMRQPMVVDSSRYWEVFDAYRQRFGEKRIHVIWHEEFAAEPDRVFAETCRFLRLDSVHRRAGGNEQVNTRMDAMARMEAAGRSNVPIDLEWDPAVRQRVLDTLREDNCRFLDHFGKPRDYWRGTYGD